MMPVELVEIASSQQHIIKSLQLLSNSLLREASDAAIRAVEAENSVKPLKKSVDSLTAERSKMLKRLKRAEGRK